jgi:hypothetical protein
VFIAKGYGPAPKDVSPTSVYAMVLRATCTSGAILEVRRLMLKAAESMLAENRENPAALYRWRASYMASYALSEAVMLYGVVLRFMGLKFSQVAPFFIAGVILMLFFGPRPSNAIG